MRGLPSILSPFRNDLNKFNYTGARMLDSIYLMILKLLKNRMIGVNTSRFYHLFRNVIMDVITLRYQICKPLVVYRIYCMALYHSQTRRHVITINREISTSSCYSGKVSVSHKKSGS